MLNTGERAINGRYDLHDHTTIANAIQIINVIAGNKMDIQSIGGSLIVQSRLSRQVC
jgi:hypothetical protein